VGLGAANGVLGLGPGSCRPGRVTVPARGIGSTHAPPRERCRTVRWCSRQCQEARRLVARGGDIGGLALDSRRAPRPSAPARRPAGRPGRHGPARGRMRRRAPRRRRRRRARLVGAPREVNVVLKDWIFLPDPGRRRPGRDGPPPRRERRARDPRAGHRRSGRPGLLGGRPSSPRSTQPPGPTPAVRCPPDVSGSASVVPSGQRIDVTWTVPRRPRRSPGSCWAATSRATGRRACGPRGRRGSSALPEPRPIVAAARN
jgi:hypothetical protein